MRKKSQLAVFFIIGLLIIIISYVIYNNYANVSLKKDTSLLMNSKLEQIEKYLELCLRDVSRSVLFESIAPSGGFSQKELNESIISSYLLLNKRFAYWNDGVIDISPSVEEFEEKLGQMVFEDVDKCFLDAKEIFFDVEFDAPTYGSNDIFYKLNDDHIEVTINPPLSLQFDNNKASITKIVTKLDYNFKRDIELAKFILQEALSTQPSYYDILQNCYNYKTNGKTNIYSLDVPNQNGDYVTIISIIDYEPIYRDNFRSLRLNFALRNVSIMGFCSG